MLEVVAFDPALDSSALVAFLCANEWPFHVFPRPGEEKARGWLEAGRFHTPGSSRSAWLVEAGERLGFVTLEELEDPTPIFDLRVAEKARRRGVGRRAVAWCVEEAFRVEGKTRIEAHTRADNAGMRGVLRAMPGWAQEAHHRRAWPDAEGRHHDAVTYALLREDWQRGTKTPVPPLEG